MPFLSLIPAGMSLLGGLMGSEKKTTGQTQQKIDPRMDQLIYGAGGIMPNASAWYMKNQTGLNDKMLTGMNNQWNQLGASSQGFNQMQNLGMGLMGGGYGGGGGVYVPPAQTSYQPAQTSYQPAEFNAAASSTSPFVMPEPLTAPAAPVAPAVDPRGVWLEDTEGGGYWSNVGRAGGYTGYKGDAWSPAPAYQFNNGYTAYGADGSSASDPSGGGDYGFGGAGGYGGWGDDSSGSDGSYGGGGGSF